MMPSTCNTRAVAVPVMPTYRPTVEQVLLVFHEPQLERRRNILPVDLADFDQTEQINNDLEYGENADGDDGGFVHGGIVRG